MRTGNTELQLKLDFTALPQLLTPREIYDECTTVNGLTRFKEDRRIERKQVQYDVRQLAEYFSMWANTPPDGGL
jgi:ATP-dependent DNA helicase RecG